MLSMTGFGAAIKTEGELKLEIQVRSVNSRFFDLKLHMPKEYMPFENELKKQIGETLYRGNIDVFIHRKSTSKASATQITADAVLAKKWLEAYKQLAVSLDMPAAVTPLDIVRAINVIQVDEQAKVDENEKEMVFEVVQQAIDNCQAERTREGVALSANIQHHIATLSLCTQKMQELRATVEANLRQRYLERLKNLGLQAEVDEQRLSTEIIILIDKTDISEELTRLAEHTASCLKLLQDIGPGRMGKKLDFYCQELLREVNTVGSKSQNAALTSLVVEAKGVIEQMREQVQNIE